MGAKPTNQEKRKSDPYLDRRSGEDQRKAYDLDHFTEGGLERREAKERRKRDERRKDCVKVSRWSSVCPKNETDASEE